MNKKVVLKEIVVDYYFYLMEGVFEKGNYPHVYSKDEIEKNFKLDYELNCFKNIVEWWKLYCRNHNATCEYMTCTAVLSNGNKYLIYESEPAGLLNDTQLENSKQENKGSFLYNGKEVTWDDLPLEIRKEDYPYYFDEDGNDCYPVYQRTNDIQEGGERK